MCLAKYGRSFVVEFLLYKFRTWLILMGSRSQMSSAIITNYLILIPCDKGVTYKNRTRLKPGLRLEHIWSLCDNLVHLWQESYANTHLQFLGLAQERFAVKVC